MSYDLHPLSSLFPRITGPEFDALVADIKANGLREPIVVHQGLILDGGNRYRACLEAGIDPAFTEFAGGNLVSFVLSANLHRRHLSPGQQAAIVASAQDWANAQTVGGNGANQHGGAKVQDCTIARSAADRAAQSGASLRTQKMADKVAKQAPDLAKKVAHGEISLPEAVEQVTGKRPGAKPAADPAPSQPDADEGEDLHQMLLDMQRECEDYARRLSDWERAMAGDGRESLVTAIKRYEHAEREKAMSDERAAMYQKQRDQALQKLKAIGRAVGEADPDKVVRAVQALAKTATPANAAEV